MRAIPILLVACRTQSSLRSKSTKLPFLNDKKKIEGRDQSCRKVFKHSERQGENFYSNNLLMTIVNNSSCKNSVLQGGFQ